jgi:hypothetical protein
VVSDEKSSSTAFRGLPLCRLELVPYNLKTGDNEDLISHASTPVVAQSSGIYHGVKGQNRETGRHGFGHMTDSHI